jgi:hypothetical protein
MLSEPTPFVLLFLCDNNTNMAAARFSAVGAALAPFNTVSLPPRVFLVGRSLQNMIKPFLYNLKLHDHRSYSVFINPFDSDN